MLKKLNYIQKDVDISSLSNFKTKAFSKYYFEINTRQDIDMLVDIFKKVNKEKIPYLFIG
jgi:hypothetical protein